MNAIKSLCSKYPSKHRSFISFLSCSLREEGGFEFKRAIVDCILHIIHSNDENKELGLMHLSEFIEDCEYTQLSVHILHVLGEDGPSTTEPKKFIRYIYNRLFLENATIRGAAVTALMNFGTSCPTLRDSLAILLLRCIHDADDEVRDRATLCRHWLKTDGAMSVPDLQRVREVECALDIYLNSNTEQVFKIKDASSVEIEVASVYEFEGRGQVADEKEEIAYVSALKAHTAFAHVSGDILVRKFLIFLKRTSSLLRRVPIRYHLRRVKRNTRFSTLHHFLLLNLMTS